MELFRSSHTPVTKREVKTLYKNARSNKKRCGARFWDFVGLLGIVKNLVKKWNLDTINKIMLACIIMHNMMIEDEQGQDLKG